MKPKPNINFDTLRVWLTPNPNRPLLSASTSSMLKTKTRNVKRSPLLDAPEVTNKPKMNLRSPSTCRVPPQLRPAKPPTRLASSDEEDSATEGAPSQPAVDAEFCNTEQARAILGAMKPAGKTKKLNALAKSPSPSIHIVQTPPRKKKPPMQTRSPTPVPKIKPPAPDFDHKNSMGTDDEAEENLDAITSIRCKKSQNVASGDEGGEKKKVRGVVNGSNVAYYKHTRNKGLPIKVEFLPDATGPASRKVCSLVVHEIDSVVRDKVPMLAPSFMKLKEHDRQIVYDYLNPNFVIDPKDDQLWNFISQRAIERYRHWKADCKLFYKENEPNERGEAMSKVRIESERLNHRSDKVPFYMRAVELKVLGEKAHIVATYAMVYSADPAGASLAAQMEEKVRQALRDLNGGDESDEGSVLDEQEPLPVDTQL
ncbi:hypothetical protein QQ045_013990 [Rhodiola kirilowii]